MKEASLICANFIRESMSTVVLTGAGISTNAGIPDFRGPTGIYRTGKYDPQKIFEFTSFIEDPKPFYDFARDFIKLVESCKPTFAHEFFAKLERIDKLDGIITQNIDALHERAGSKNIINLHGSIHKSYCLKCGKEYSFEEMKRKIFEEEIPHCRLCKGLIKPDIVFFGEDVKGFSQAEKLVYFSELFLVVGTSLEVFPANSLVDFARGRIVFVGKGVSKLNRYADLIVDKDIDEFFREVYVHLEDLFGEA